METIDVLIIGGGPAGAQAAVYAARGGLSVRMVHNGASALAKAERIENFYGCGCVSGGELFSRGLEQAARAGADIAVGEVTACRTDGDMFYTYSSAGEIVSRAVVIATGAVRKSADIEGLKRFEGRGVSYCAVCDAFFYRGKDVAVLGSGAFAEHELSVLKAAARSVTLFTNGLEPEFLYENVQKCRIARLVGGERLSAVELEDGRSIPVSGLFVALGVMGAGELAKSLGAFVSEKGGIKTDGRGMTNIPRLFAAGDCTDGVKQVAKAAFDGMTVGLALVSELKR